MLVNKKSRRIKPNPTLVGTKETNKVVLCLLLLTLIIGLLGICNLILLANNNKLASKRTVFVQEPDGSTQLAQEKDENYRADEVVRSTVANWLPLMWEWDNRIAGSDTVDRGLQIGSGGNLRVPTKVYMASFLLSPEFRWEHLKKIATEIPQEVYKGSVRSVFEIHYLGKPIRKENTYEIIVMGIRTDIAERGQLKRESRYSKTIVLKPVEPYRTVLKDSEPSAFRKQLAELLKNGLMVTSIRDLKPGEI